MPIPMLFIHVETDDYDEKNKYEVIVSSKPVDDPEYESYRTVIRHYASKLAANNKANVLRNIFTDACINVQLDLD